MKIDITVVKENEDGSATCEVDLCEDGRNYLVKLGLERLIMESVDYIKENDPKNWVSDLPVTPEEEEVWKDDSRQQLENKASTYAWNAAADFISNERFALENWNLREAFEEGYRQGFLDGFYNAKG